MIYLLFFFLPFWQVGWDTLHEEFSQLLLKGKKKLGEDDEIFDKLKMAVIETCKTRHQWENKAEDSLVKLTLLQA